MSTEPYKPSIPPVVRTTVYVVGLTVGFVVMLIVPISAIWWPDQAMQVTATATAVSAAVGWLASALGVVYRPTGHETPQSDYQPRYAARD